MSSVSIIRKSELLVNLKRIIKKIFPLYDSLTQELHVHTKQYTRETERKFDSIIKRCNLT